jgi:anti-anti-sigma factor
MPTDWSDGIVLADLSDEPELAEEFSAIAERLKATPTEKLPHVVLNFGGVSYLNSSHIAALLRMRKRVVEGRKQLVLCSMSDQVWAVMLLTGLDKVFQFAPDTMTALARVQITDSRAEGAEG